MNIAHWVGSGIFLLAVVGIPFYAACKKVRVYDSFVEGAGEGIQICFKIFPFLLAMLIAIAMFRAAGGFTLLGIWLAPLLNWIGVPGDLLPLAFTRPFSGSGANALLVELIHQHGPDSLLARMGATLMGSTETTFYVIAIYFGAVKIFNVRHSVIAGLLADAAGVIASVWICRLIF